MTRESIEVTRQDRIFCLKASSNYHSEVCEECKFYPDCDHMTQDDMAELTIKDLEALEQEPCEDAIRRQAVMDCFKKWQPYMATRLHEFEKELSALPPVNPQPKTGKWMETDSADPYWYMCSECHRRLFEQEAFCPSCGAKMK